MIREFPCRHRENLFYMIKEILIFAPETKTNKPHEEISLNSHNTFLSDDSHLW